MNRTEQLTLDLFDGVLDPAGLDELEALVAGDPAARAVHLALCEQEAALRGQFSGIDVSAQAMARLRAALGQAAGQMPPAYAQPPSSETANSETPAGACFCRLFWIGGKNRPA